MTQHIFAVLWHCYYPGRPVTWIKSQQQVIGFPVLKNMQDLPQRISYLTDNRFSSPGKIINDYHFGGYAKKTSG
jgi:1-aminocyclopropane-1-carboxylate deaminase/D-cysteine desulfhydrase-like pyridoxal-dependent ACC family enzyme